MKVLVVDDSQTVRRSIRRELEEGGYEVIEAGNGLEAITRIAGSHPPDLITLDIEMPHLNGFETLRKLRTPPYSQHFYAQTSKGIPTILVTGKDTLEERQQGFDLGAAEFITKPFAQGDILSVVNKILAPNTYMQEMKVLVVDDSPLTRSTIVDMLDHEGLTVLQAQNGEEAFSLFCEHGERINLILTDYEMPELTGYELCHKIRSELQIKDLPIIFLTSISDQAKILDVFKIGASDYIVKPFAKEELLARIKAHLERGRMIQKLKDMVKELNSLNRMKDNLLAVCSHDLRSPLNAILGYSEMLLEQDHLTREDKKSLQHILSSGNVLLELINDILDVSKMQKQSSELKMQDISLQEVIQESCQLLRAMAEQKSQEVVIENHGAQDRIHGNFSSMVRVVNNLLSNAIKFTPEQGTITLSLQEAKSGQVALNVQDTGIGIAEDKRQYLFQQFTSVSQSGTSGEAGTGLGMYIVKEILNQHQASIDIQSTPGQGTTFTLLFDPAHKEPATERDDATRPEQSPAPEQGLNILLVEDNQDNQTLFTRVLKKAGHRVRIAGNGQEGVDAFLQDPEGFHLILMDVQMPKMDGLQATRLIREKGFDRIVIIALTAHNDQKIMEKCKQAGMNDYLQKPLRKKELMQAVHAWTKNTASFGGDL